MDFNEKVEPEEWIKYTFKINPPIVYGEGEDMISHDVVLAHTEEDARRILINSYGNKFKRDYELISEESVLLFQNSYMPCGEEEKTYGTE